MPETKKTPEIKNDEEAIERYTKVLEDTGLTHEKAASMANDAFSPIINSKKPKTAK